MRVYPEKIELKYMNCNVNKHKLKDQETQHKHMQN